MKSSRFSVLLLASLVAAPFALAVTPAELSARLARNERILIVDIRPAHAFGEGHIPGAINIPLSLLPHKQVPASQPIVICGDGLGVADDQKALGALRAKPGINADVLEGGYAAWLAETRVSTAASGVTRERVPGITYDQLVAAGKGDLVLVDLRAPGATVATAAAKNSDAKRPATAALRQTDVVNDFARKLGVSVVAPAAQPLTAAARSSVAAGGESRPGATSRAAAAVESLGKSDKLLVLVADDEAEANEVARQLRARGQYRFTVLIGGTESIRHEGRVGSGRMDGGQLVPPTPEK